MKYTFPDWYMSSLAWLDSSCFVWPEINFRINRRRTSSQPNDTVTGITCAGTLPRTLTIMARMYKAIDSCSRGKVRSRRKKSLKMWPPARESQVIMCGDNDDRLLLVVIDHTILFIVAGRPILRENSLLIGPRQDVGERYANFVCDTNEVLQVCLDWSFLLPDTLKFLRENDQNSTKFNK